MARKPKKKSDENSVKNVLLTALKFLEPAASETGNPNQTHCQLANKQAVIFNGLIAMGIAIETDIIANPHLKLFVSALSKCREEIQITQLTNNQLSIKSGKFQAYVPCIEPELLSPVAPNQSCGTIDERIFKALEITGKIAQENAPRLLLASVMLRNGSSVATDGIIMFECWHGIGMPTVILPKSSISTLLKIDKKPIAFGVPTTDGRYVEPYNAITFWFEDGSWFRTQLYVEPYPNVDKILNQASTPWPVPAGLWEALNAIEDFTQDNNRVYFDGKNVRTHSNKDDKVGAAYEIDGVMPTGLILNREYLSMFEPLAITADFTTNPDLCSFYGDNFRGVLSKIKEEQS